MIEDLEGFVSKPMKTIVAFVIYLGAMLIAPVVGHANDRIALVVGNSSYTHIPALRNPSNDAELIAARLKKLGFKLTGGGPQMDMSKSGLETAIKEFGKQIQSADVALFYYAGHGIQVRGSNYLIPVGANPTREADVDFEMIDANLILRQMEASGSKLNVMLLDACRNNPFGSRGFRSASSGLAQMQAPAGTIISFATQPGNVALDGVGDNSPYTAALVEALEKPGLDVFRTFNYVGVAVSEKTAGQQQPWLSISPISGEFYFNAAGNQEEQIAAVTFSESQTSNEGEVSALQKEVDRLKARLDAANREKANSDPEPIVDNATLATTSDIDLSRQETKEVQQKLASLGHDPGPADGQIGPKTRKAIRDARKALKLSDGQHIDLALFQRLNDLAKVETPKNKKARRFSVSELSKNADPRIVNAVSKLPFELKFGKMNGHVYVAVLTWHGVDWDEGQRLAESIGGNLVSITSKRENEFVYQLVREDERFWSMDGIGSAWIGPVIGIRQAPNSNEPAGGWRWASGERVTYKNWMPGQPNNWGGIESFAAFMISASERERNNPPRTSRLWGDISGPMRGIVIEID